VRVGVIVVGGLVVLTGLVWVGQGLGYIKGSFMTGDMKWFWIGCAMVLVGATILGASALVRRPRQAHR
jgi:hypothetical protein